MKMNGRYIPILRNSFGSRSETSFTVLRYLPFPKIASFTWIYRKGFVLLSEKKRNKAISYEILSNGIGNVNIFNI